MAGKGASVRIVGATAFVSISGTEACAKSAEAAAFACITGRKACARLAGAAGFVSMAGAEVSARLAGAAAFACMTGEEADARIAAAALPIFLFRLGLLLLLQGYEHLAAVLRPAKRRRGLPSPPLALLLPCPTRDP